MKLIIICALLVTLTSTSVECKRRHKGHLPIDNPVEMRSKMLEEAKKNRRASECRFGDKRYELEQTWNPDLGSPFGVMYCVHCECVRIHKKRRIVGRVRCKNIKSECPVPSCPDPVLLPGRCCKVCPGQDDINPDLNIEVDLAREEEEKYGRHYAALMTPEWTKHGYLHPEAATGRFYFRKKTLSYSFVASDGFGLPKMLTFLDPEGKIVEEFPLQNKEFQNATGKVCGSWNRLPRRYRKDLRRDLITAQLTNEEGKVVRGKVAKHYGLATELFSAHLLPDRSAGSTAMGSATAVISTSADTGSIHALVLLHGIVGFIDAKDVEIKVKFEAVSNRERRVLEETVKIPKVDPREITQIDFKTVFDEPELNALGRGQLKMSIVTGLGEVLGHISPRFACEVLDSVLTPEEQVAPAQMTPTRGIAWMFVTPSGAINYKVKLEDLRPTEVVTRVSIDNDKKSKRLLKVVTESVDPVFDAGGVTSGTMTLSAGDVEDLYKDALYVNIDTNLEKRSLRGRIDLQMMTDAHELAAPMLLKSNQTRIAAIGWTNVDSTCRLNYQLRLTEMPAKAGSKLTLKDYPMKNLKSNYAMMSGRTEELQSFRGAEVAGHEDNVHKLTMARLDAGDASFVITSKAHEGFEIEGRIDQVRAPTDCLPRYARNELELMPGFLSDTGEERPEVEMELATRCLYEGQIYEDGVQWPSTHTKCQMCACNAGKVVCEALLCPKADCASPVIPEGECCATCATNTPTSSDGGQVPGCFFEGDKKFHTAGTVWHPFLPPFGFDRCATCTCKADTLTVTCSRQACPRLDCPREQQVRPDDLACCKVCGPPPSTKAPKVFDPEQLGDEGEERTDYDILASGGCEWKNEVYENGNVWHPRVQPYGEVRCVKCTCKEGHTKCKKHQCPKLSCRYKIWDTDSCCQRCAANKAEVKRAKKHNRDRKLRKLRRMKEKLRRQRNRANRDH